MSSKLRVASVQFELRPEKTFEAFADHVTSVVEDAALAGADLVVLPELVGTGLLASHPKADTLTRGDMKQVFRELYPELADRFSELVAGLAAETGLTIMGGTFHRTDEAGRFVNTAFLAHPDGRMDTQDKLHLTPPEVALSADRGEQVLITRVGPATVGIQICMDVQFPEVTRYLALQGVDLVLCPSLTWNRRGGNRIKYSSLSRALENQLFVVTSVARGSCGVPADGALHGTGQSMVTCPIDKLFGVHDGILATAEGADEQVVVADLDFDLIRESRANPEPPGLANLRPELYRTLVADVVA
jgi:predicted amidohydrolase